VAAKRDGGLLVIEDMAVQGVGKKKREDVKHKAIPYRASGDAKGWIK